MRGRVCPYSNIMAIVLMIGEAKKKKKEPKELKAKKKKEKRSGDR